MASLTKRGKYYYGRWQKVEAEERVDVRKSLGIRYKGQAEKAMEELIKMEERGEIDPFSPGFDPKQILEELNHKYRRVDIYTVRDAADYFYRRKSHLSNKTVKNSENDNINEQGAYEQALEHFISLNKVADIPIRKISIDHFEKVIFKPGLASSSRHFYFRQLRVWWNLLLRKKVVKHDYFTELKKDLPSISINTRPKMLAEPELIKLFEAFDEELEKKRKKKHFAESQIQYWFKPLIATYFYGGLRRNEAAYDPDLLYSGLKGNNLFFDSGDLQMIYLGATKGQRERFVPISREWRKYMMDYLSIRGEIRDEKYTDKAIHLVDEDCNKKLRDMAKYLNKPKNQREFNKVLGSLWYAA